LDRYWSRRQKQRRQTRQKNPARVNDRRVSLGLDGLSICHAETEKENFAGLGNAANREISAEAQPYVSLQGANAAYTNHHTIQCTSPAKKTPDKAVLHAGHLCLMYVYYGSGPRPGIPGSLFKVYRSWKALLFCGLVHSFLKLAPELWSSGPWRDPPAARLCPQCSPGTPPFQPHPNENGPPLATPNLNLPLPLPELQAPLAVL